MKIPAKVKINMDSDLPVKLIISTRTVSGSLWLSHVDLKPDSASTDTIGEVKDGEQIWVEISK